MQETVFVPNKFGIRALNLMYNDILGGQFFRSHPVLLFCVIFPANGQILHLSIEISNKGTVDHLTSSIQNYFNFSIKKKPIFQTKNWKLIKVFQWVEMEEGFQNSTWYVKQPLDKLLCNTNACKSVEYTRYRYISFFPPNHS